MLYKHGNITGWLMVALRFNFKNRQRKWRIWKRRSAEVDGSADIFSVQPNPVEDALFNEDKGVLDIIRDAIGDEGKFNAFIDYHIHKVPIKTLAEARGISEDAMKMQLHRCRRICRTALEANGISLPFLLLIRVTCYYIFARETIAASDGLPHPMPKL